MIEERNTIKEKQSRNRSELTTKRKNAVLFPQVHNEYNPQ